MNILSGLKIVLILLLFSPLITSLTINLNDFNTASYSNLSNFGYSFVQFNTDSIFPSRVNKLTWSGWLEHETPVKELDSGSASFFDDNVIAYYKFNGDSVDSSDSGFDGIDTNVSWSSGKWGTQAGEFNGVDSIVNTSSDWMPLGDFSISAWINPYDWGENNNGRIIEQNGGKIFGVYKANSSLLFNSGSVAISGSYSIKLNEWQHVVVTHDENGIANFYVNGKLSGTPNQNSGILNPTGLVMIGNNLVNNRTFDGLIDELVVFDKVLSADEVRGLYNDASVDKNLIAYYHLNDNNGTHVMNSAPATSNKYHGEIVGGFDTTVSGLWDYNAGFFNGVNAGIDTGSDFIESNDLTISAWIKPNSFGASGFDSVLSNGAIEFGLSGDNNGLFFSSMGIPSLSWSLDYDSSGTRVSDFAEYNGKLYAGSSNGGVFVYDGVNWNETYSLPVSYILSLAVYNNKLYASSATTGEIFVFDGSTWEVSYDSEESWMYSLTVYDGKLYAGTGSNGKVFVFDGSTWSESYDSAENFVGDLIEYDGKLYAAAVDVIFVFDGSTWSESYDSAETRIYSLGVYGGKLYAGTGDNGKVFVFDGSTWSESYDSAETRIYSLAVFDDKLYAGATTGKIFVFDGSTWDLAFESTETLVGALIEYGGKLYAGTNDAGKIFVFGKNGFAVSNIDSVDVDAWNHVTITRNETGLTNFYVNGLLSGSADQNSGNPTAGLNNVFLGNDINGLRGFDGLIQDLKVWNKALTQNEVIDDYNAWRNAYFDSNIVGTGTGSVFDGVSFNDGEGFGAEIDSSNDLYDANLIALYNFNGNATDSSNNGNDGIAPNVSYNTGKWETQAVEFNESDSSIDTGSDWIGASPITISAWIKPYSTGVSDLGTILYNGKVIFRLFGANKRLMFWGNGEIYAYTSENSITLNEWQHILVTRDENGITNFYINGILSGSADQNSGTPVVASNNVFIGDNHLNTLGFDGLIEDLAVWDRVLSIDEIVELYDSSVGSIDFRYRASNSLSNFGSSDAWSDIVVTDGLYDVPVEDRLLYSQVRVLFDGVDGVGNSLFDVDDVPLLSGVNFILEEDSIAPICIVDFEAGWGVSKELLFSCVDELGGDATVYYRIDGNELVGRGLDESVLGLYHFNDDVNDYSGADHNGMATNVNFNTGKWGTQAAEFNGVDSVINTGSAWLPTEEMTISVWIYPYDYGETAGRIIDNSDAQLKSYLYITPTRAGFRDLTTLSNEITTPHGSVVLNTWQHFVVTRTNTGDLDFYINGLKAVDTKPGAGTVIAGSEVMIGNRVGGDRTFDGLIDELVVFDRVLSAEDVNALYNGFSRVSLVEDGNSGSIIINWDGNHLVDFIGVDDYNNWSDVNSVYVGVDLNAPVLSVDFNAGLLNQEQSVKVSCIDSGIGCADIYYRVDTDSGIDINLGNWTVYGSSIDFTNDGNYLVEVVGTDGLDHNSNIFVFEQVLNLVPSNSYVDYNGSWFNGGDINVGINSVGADLNSLWYRVDTDANFETSFGEWNIVDVSNGLDVNVFFGNDGNYAFEFFSFDSNGLVEDVNRIYVLVDSTPGLIQNKDFLFSINDADKFVFPGEVVSFNLVDLCSVTLGACLNDVKFGVIDLNGDNVWLNGILDGNVWSADYNVGMFDVSEIDSKNVLLRLVNDFDNSAVDVNSNINSLNFFDVNIISGFDNNSIGLYGINNFGSFDLNLIDINELVELEFVDLNLLDLNNFKNFVNGNWFDVNSLDSDDINLVLDFDELSIGSGVFNTKKVIFSGLPIDINGWLMVDDANCSSSICNNPIWSKNDLNKGVLEINIIGDGVFVTDYITPELRLVGDSGSLTKDDIVFGVVSNERVVCRYSYSNVDFSSMSIGSETSSGLSHSWSINDLKDGDYSIFIGCADVVGNVETANVNLKIKTNSGYTYRSNDAVDDSLIFSKRYYFSGLSGGYRLIINEGSVVGFDFVFDDEIVGSLRVKEFNDVDLLGLNGLVYSFLDFSADFVFDGAIVSFKVNDSWLNEHNGDVDRVGLLHLVDGKWVKEIVEYVGFENGYHYFEAKLNSFSWYAIILNEKEKIEQEIIENKDGSMKVLKIQKISNSKNGILNGLVTLGLSDSEGIIELGNEISVDRIIESERTIDGNKTNDITNIKITIKNESDNKLKNLVLTEFIPTKLTDINLTINGNHRLINDINAIEFSLGDLEIEEEIEIQYSLNLLYDLNKINSLPEPILFGNKEQISSTYNEPKIDLTTAIAITLIVLIIGLIIGHYFWKNKKEKNKSELEKTFSSY